MLLVVVVVVVVVGFVRGKHAGQERAEWDVDALHHGCAGVPKHTHTRTHAHAHARTYRCTIQLSKRRTWWYNSTSELANRNYSHKYAPCLLVDEVLGFVSTQYVHVVLASGLR